MADISHMGEDQQPWQKQEPIVTGPSFLATLPSFWKNKNNYKKLDSCCIFESLSENNAEWGEARALGNDMDQGLPGT